MASSGQCICSIGYFLNSTTSVCVTCSSIDPLCDSCLNNLGNLTCISCSTGYYPVSNVCQLCSTAILGCLDCSDDGSNCTLCDSALNMQVGSGGQCICSTGYFQNATTLTCIACTTIDPLCASCSLILLTPSCSSCSLGYFIQANACISCAIPLIGCTSCDNNSVCNACDGTNHYQLQVNVCVCTLGYFSNSSNSFQC